MFIRMSVYIYMCVYVSICICRAYASGLLQALTPYASVEMPESSRLAYVGEDGVVRIFDVPSGQVFGLSACLPVRQVMYGSVYMSMHVCLHVHIDIHIDIYLYMYLNPYLCVYVYFDVR